MSDATPGGDFKVIRRDVSDFEVVQIQGGGAYIRVRDVGEYAIIRAFGAEATIEVHGVVSAHALLQAVGARARIVHRDAHPTATFQAIGHDAEVSDMAEIVTRVRGRKIDGGGHE